MILIGIFFDWNISSYKVISDKMQNELILDLNYLIFR